MSRGKKIVELFTNLKTHIEDREGMIDMNMSAIRPDPANKTACIGCWLADYFETKVAGDGYRHFEYGINALEKHLDVDDLKHFLRDNRELWHNDYALRVFHRDGYAYDAGQYPSITDVTDAWISFGEKLQIMED